MFTHELQGDGRATGRGHEREARAAGVDEALKVLRAELAPGDVVLVKASRAAGLERVAAGLLSETGLVAQ